MARKRKIPSNPKDQKNYFLVDANFLAYAAIPKRRNGSFNIKEPKEREYAVRCLEWWEQINKQLKNGCARVYVPDICIAEAFKVLAKWYYRRGYFSTSSSYDQAKKRLRRFVSSSHDNRQKRIEKLLFMM